MRGSRETLGKGSLCERAALAIANQVQQVLEFPSHPFWDVFPEVWRALFISVVNFVKWLISFAFCPLHWFLLLICVGNLLNYTSLVARFFAKVAFGDSVQSLEIPGSLKEVSLERITYITYVKLSNIYFISMFKVRLL